MTCSPASVVSISPLAFPLAEAVTYTSILDIKIKIFNFMEKNKPLRPQNDLDVPRDVTGQTQDRYNI